MTLDWEQPDFLLFAQHGWADTGKDINSLANAVATPRTIVTVPSLGLVQTFIRIEPLVNKLEQIATEVIRTYPNIPLKIMGHSMGGLMWLEVLNRNPQWWMKVHSFVLLGSPVGGSNIARAIDPLKLGIGTAKDLGQSRRHIAEKIARQIPTLSVASDTGMGTDGLVTVENTKFDYANLIVVPGIPHHLLKCHSAIIPLIQDFWQNPQLGVAPKKDLSSKLIQRLRLVPGMTDTDYRHFERSQIIADCADGTTLNIWKSVIGINHIYVGREKLCLFAGYVGLIHNLGLHRAIQEIKQYIAS